MDKGYVTEDEKKSEGFIFVEALIGLLIGSLLLTSVFYTLTNIMAFISRNHKSFVGCWAAHYVAEYRWDEDNFSSPDLGFWIEKKLVNSCNIIVSVFSCSFVEGDLKNHEKIYELSIWR